MDFSSIKSGFLNYLEEKFNKSEVIQTQDGNEVVQASSNKVIPDSEISVFLYNNDFKNYLVSEVGADSSIFSKSVNEIMDMEFVNGKLVENEETNSDNFETESQDNEQNAEQVNMSISVANEENGQVAPQEADAANISMNILNDALSNGSVISALDSNQTGEVDKEEFTEFLNGVKNENGEITLDGLTNALKEIIAPENKGQEETVDSYLNAIYENPSVINALDVDGDGQISDEEKSKFLEYVKQNYANGSELTLQALKDAFQSIIDGSFSYDKGAEQVSSEKQSVRAAEKPEGFQSGGSGGSSPVNSAGGSSGASGSSGTSGSGGYSGGNGVSSSGASSASAPKGKTLEELEQEKTTKEGELSDAREAVNDVYSGENSEVKSAKQAEEDAKTKYDEAVKNDEKISDELKNKRETNLNDIATEENNRDTKKTEINNKESEISSLESDLSSAESEVSALSDALSALEGQSSDDPEKQQEIETKKAEVQKKKEEAEKKVEELKGEIETKKGEKSDLESELQTIESNLKDLNETKAQIEEEISKNCEPETKAAMDAYNEAKENTETVKDTEAEKAKGVVDTKQSELDSINKQIDEKKAEETKRENSVSDLDFSGVELNLSGVQEEDMEAFKSNWEKNKDKYEEVAEATGMPAELIAAIHWREGSGDFSTYLHNGEKLGQVTTLEPAGVYFEDWTEAAIDAINREKGNATMENDGSLEYYLNYAEGYNGWGYHNKGVVSPYVWAGTSNYKSGKYVADGVYNAGYVDQQLGVAAMMKAIMEG